MLFSETSNALNLATIQYLLFLKEFTKYLVTLLPSTFPDTGKETLNSEIRPMTEMRLPAVETAGPGLFTLVMKVKFFK